MTDVNMVFTTTYHSQYHTYTILLVFGVTATAAGTASTTTSPIPQLDLLVYFWQWI